MKPRVTLALLLAAALLGGVYWYVEVKTKPAREAAKEDAKRIFPGEAAKSSGEILLRASGKPDVILRQVDGVWNLVAPVQTLADADAVKTLIDELNSAAKDEIVEEKAADAHKYGLDLPSGSVSFKPLSGKAAVLLFGAESFDERRVYGQVEGQSQVFLSSGSVKAALLRDANVLRNKSLLVFDPEQVASIRSSAKKGFSLEHNAQGQWQVREGAQVEPADAGRVMAWMAALRNIKGDTVVEERAPSSPKYGVGGSPRISIALKGKANLAILKGRLKDKGPNFYAQVQGQGQVWSLPAAAVGALDKEGHALMDLRAFEVHAGSVERLVVWQPGLTLTAKRVDQKWAWDPPYTPKAGEAAFNLDEFVAKVGGAERLSRLSAKALPGKPLMSVTFYGPSDTVLDQALVGPKQGAGQLAQSSAKHLVMIVADNVFAGLPKPGKELAVAQPADLYAVLGVPEDADADAIKKAFRDLAKKHHPDANPGNKKSEERFKEASQAYEILSDPEKRRRYDAMRRSPFQGGGMEDDGGDAFGGGQNINDLFEMFFGGGGGPFGGQRGRSRRPQKGPDLESEVWVSMEDAALGRSVSVSLEGGQPLKLNLPAGADDGLRLRLTGQGGSGPAGNGDLYLTLRVRPSAHFKREGLDTVANLHLNLAQALLGTTVTVLTLRGSVRMKVPPGSVPGTRLRIPGQGIEADGKKGDHYVVLGVDLPKDLDDAERAQIEAMAKKREWEL